MRTLFCALLIFVGICRAQPAVGTAIRSPEALTAYLRSQRVVDWDALRNALGIAKSKLWIPPCGVPDIPAAEARCSSERVTADHPDQSIVVIRGGEFSYSVEFLRYLHLPDGTWRFAGEASTIKRNGPTHYQLRHFGIKPFFTITSDRSQNGIGVQQVLQDWFDLTQPSFVPVFSITIHASEWRFAFGVGRTIEAVPALTESKGVETFQVALSVHFNGPSLNEPASYTGVYERRDDAPKFTLRNAYSETPRRAPMPKEDFAELADPFSGISNEKLLRYALPGLKKIATGPDGDAKQWLRSILQNANDTAEKRLLLDLLQDW